jgi:hypothetical protein
MQKNAQQGSASMYGLINLTAMWSEYWLNYYKKQIPKQTDSVAANPLSPVSKPVTTQKKREESPPLPEEEVMAEICRFEEQLKSITAIDQRQNLERCIRGLRLSLTKTTKAPEVATEQKQEPQEEKIENYGDISKTLGQLTKKMTLAEFIRTGK